MFRKLLVAIFLLVPSILFAQDPELTITWTAPTHGTAVSYYILQISSSDDGETYSAYADWQVIVNTPPLEEYTFTGTPLTFYLARVRAVDAEGNMGPWDTLETPWATSANDPTLPGIPGKPTSTLIRP